MKRLYVFRMDGAKANDAFFAVRCAREGGVVAYQGRRMAVGIGWTPDLIEVESDENGTALVTLVELEPTRPAAMVSCRKYLPEPSALIMESFAKYLHTIVSDCRTTADPRLADIRRFKESIEGGVKVTLCTAGAVRSARQYCEMFALMDQPERLSCKPREKQARTPVFGPGANRFFSRREADGLRRAVRVLHAVVVGKDRCDCPFRRWKARELSPLDDAVAAEPRRRPALHELLVAYLYRGTQIDFDQIVAEMADVWRDLAPRHWTTGTVATIIARFADACMHIDPDLGMQTWFGAARAALRRAGWQAVGKTAIRRRTVKREAQAA